MTYTLPNGKNIRIPDSEIEKNMKLLELTRDEAIQLYLEDEGYLENAEQEALCQKAKANVKVGNIVKARADTKPKPKTQSERVKKDDPTKEMIIAEIAEFLPKIATNIQIVDNRKIITFCIGGDTYKIDLTRTRKPKSQKMRAETPPFLYKMLIFSSKCTKNAEKSAFFCVKCTNFSTLMRESGFGGAILILGRRISYKKVLFNYFILKFWSDPNKNIILKII